MSQVISYNSKITPSIFGGTEKPLCIPQYLGDAELITEPETIRLIHCIRPKDQDVRSKGVLCTNAETNEVAQISQVAMQIMALWKDIRNRCQQFGMVEQAETPTRDMSSNCMLS